MELELDDYEVVNLREGLYTLRAVGCDTGDWLGQILNKLDFDMTMGPNVTQREQMQRIFSHVRIQDRP